MGWGQEEGRMCQAGNSKCNGPRAAAMNLVRTVRRVGLLGLYNQGGPAAVEIWGPDLTGP